MGEKKPKKSLRRRMPKGEGFLYKRTADGLWVRGCEMPPDENGDRRRIQVTSKDRNVAVDKYNSLRRALEDGYTPAKGRTPTVAQVHRSMLDAKRRIGPTTRSGYESVFRSKIEPAIGGKPITAPTSADLRKLLTDIRDRGLAGQTLKNTFHRLNPLFEFAKKEGLRRDNPMERVEIPSATHNTPEPYTAEQATHLLLTAASEPRDPMYERFAVQLLQGIRQGEVLGLTERAVNLTDLTVDLSWQLQWLTLRRGFKPDSGMTVYPLAAFNIPDGYPCTPLWRTACLVPNKTRKMRVAPLLPEIAAMLEDYMARTPRGVGGLIFSRPDGKPIRATADNEAFKKLQRRAGLTAEEETDDTHGPTKGKGTHANRHTTNDLLFKLEVPEDVRMQILGQSTVTANRIYTHADVTRAREAMSKLGGLIPSAETVSSPVPISPSSRRDLAGQPLSNTRCTASSQERKWTSDAWQRPDLPVICPDCGHVGVLCVVRLSDTVNTARVRSHKSVIGPPPKPYGHLPEAGALYKVG